MLVEPCAELSVEEAAQMSAAIVELHGELDATSIVIEHDMQVVENLSGRVLVLHRGRLLATGKMAEIRCNPAV